MNFLNSSSSVDLIPSVHIFFVMFMFSKYVNNVSISLDNRSKICENLCILKLFSGSLSKICCTKLDFFARYYELFMAGLFGQHVVMNSERRRQSVAFNPLNDVPAW